MKILTSTEMAAADQAAFQKISIPSRAVMEAAGRHAASLLCEIYQERLLEEIIVIAGGGNNGGDGFVAARMLADLGASVRVFALKAEAQLKGDALANYKSYTFLGGSVEVVDESNLESMLRTAVKAGLIIDAIFGTGITGPIKGFAAKVISEINRFSLEYKIPVASIDLPSGVNGDTGAVPGDAVCADITIALQCLKAGHVLFPGAECCGRVFVVDIGISPQLPEIAQVKRELICEQSIARLVQDKFSEQSAAHKGTRGHAAVFGGSLGRYGAPKLSAQAALDTGAGLVTLVLPKAAVRQAAPSLSELMCAALSSDKQDSASDSDAWEFQEGDELACESIIEGKRAIVLGPGMGLGPGSLSVLAQVLRLCQADQVPLVIDADALNLLSSAPELVSFLGPHCVLTPHPGEMSRLIGVETKELQSKRLESACAYSAANSCWVVLKGARTIVAGPEAQAFINPTASPVLATAGSGDVLAGVIGGFLARGFDAGSAARAAVFVHGCAGELLELDGAAGVIAGDISRTVPIVINRLQDIAPRGPRASAEVLPGAAHLILGS